MKRIVLILLCVIQVFVFMSCNAKKTQNSPQVEFWSVSALDKVLQKPVNGVDYSSIKKEAVLKLDVLRGEYESTQIIMSAVNEVNAYDVQIFDLEGPDGKIFNKENIEVKKEMYIEVKTVYEPNGASRGWYPDALLPIDKAVEAKENSIDAGENQGLYITFNVPIMQTPGLYTGNIIINYDGAEKVIPVSLNVIDYAISEETHTYSYFSVGWYQHLGEIDSSREMYRNYVKFLAKYRLSAGRMMHYDSFSLRSDEGIQTYVNETWDLIKNYNVPNFEIPMTHPVGMDAELLKKYIITFAEKSVEVGENLLAKAKIYGSSIDEPYAYGESALYGVKVTQENFNKGKENAVPEVLALKEKYPDKDPVFFDEIASSVEKIPLIVTTYYTKEFEEAGVETYCPKFSEYHTEEMRAQYADQKEKWWYSCVDPRTPYPTYRIEDQLVSARSVGWMMSEYDVKGNLFWALDVYGKYSGSNYQIIENPYANSERYPATNGDGFLLYPGAKYGIEGPISSMRLEAIRDGNEDYELLNDLRNTYAEYGFSAQEIQRNISELLYSGTRVSGDSLNYFDAREAMIQLINLAKSPAGVCIYGVHDNKKGQITYEIAVNKGFALKNDGELLKISSQDENRDYYILEIDLGKKNFIALSVNIEDKEYCFDFHLANVSYYNAESLFNSSEFSDVTATVSAELKNEQIEVSIGEVKNSHQRVRFTSDILSSCEEFRQKMILHLENKTQEEMYFSLSAKFEYSSLGNDLFTGYLKPGINEIEIDIATYDFENYGKIQYFDFILSKNLGDHEQKMFYINSISIYTSSTKEKIK